MGQIENKFYILVVHSSIAGSAAGRISRSVFGQNTNYKTSLEKNPDYLKHYTKKYLENLQTLTYFHVMT